MFLKLVKTLGVAEFEFDAPTMKKLGKNLIQSRLPFSPKQYAGFAVILSAMVFLFALVVSFFFTGVFYAIAFSMFCFALALVFSLNYLGFLKKRRAESVERDMPLALRAAAVDLQFNTPFEKVLDYLSQGYGEASVEFKKISNDIRVGSSVQEALRGMAERVDSLAVKRAAMQLSFSYEHGLNAEGLRKLADELIELQKLKSKEYAAKQSFFGLLFVSVSTIIPALFSAYVIVGSVFLSLSFTPTDLYLAFIIVFPLADFSVLYYLTLVKPKVLQ
ncbi:MAG TPA: type II secretion system F family protein [Candidatus Norongarragalinales archaeon]|nr:type II secretion system F family protein [Candidatus Norongarragalinales archaeon]